MKNFFLLGCSLLKVNQHLGITCYLQPWGLKDKLCLHHADFLFGLFVISEDGGNMFV
jgi:hypothetical protein